jgi:hypothetical protein
MLTPAEANDRARALWGPTAVASKLTITSPWWWVTVDGQHGVHRIDNEGRIACHHRVCELAAQALDAQALETT